MIEEDSLKGLDENWINLPQLRARLEGKLEKKGCGKEIFVRDGKSNHGSFCGCSYKGLHLCDECEELAKGGKK